MKYFAFALALATGVVPVVRGEASETTGKLELIGPLADGAEPEPAEPKPRLVVSEDDVIRTREVPLGERMVRFQKLRPLSLPPIPEPVRAEVDPEKAAAFQQAAREAVTDRRFFFVGATVYIPDGEPEQAKSLVKFWPQPDGEAVSMWVNANMLWLGGFAEFRTGDTEYSLMMACSEVDLAKRKEISQLAQRTWEAPELPEFAGNDAAFVVVDGKPEPGDLKPFEALIGLYRKDKARLKHAYESRRQAAEQKRLERLADPPELKDLDIRYWRLDEAGRVGAKPQPESIR